MISSIKPKEKPSVDRLPPHSDECERGVIGCCLLSPNESLDDCIEKFGDDAKSMFFDMRHQTIFNLLVKMRDENTGIDLITVQQRLADEKLLQGCGGITYLSELQDCVPSTANLGWYLDHVREKYILRRLIQTCTGVISGIYDYEGDVESLVDQVEKDVLSINSSNTNAAQPSVKDFLNRAINNIEVAYNSNGKPTGIETGYLDLDGYTDGLHAGDYIVIAARPSMGKTALAMNIAEHVAVNSKIPVGIFSLEMTGESLVERMLGSVARVNIRDIKKGILFEASQPKIVSAAGLINNAPLYIDPTSGLSILQLKARARRMVQKHGIKLFVIDYLQLLHSSTMRNNDNREREIADISAGIKSLAKELNVPIIALAQLNRELEKDKNRKPRMSDLRESGAIEQDADVIGLLYKPNQDDPDTQEQQDEGETIGLLLAKQRNGPQHVTCYFTFLKKFTRFETQSKFTEQDIPDSKQPYSDN